LDLIPDLPPHTELIDGSLAFRSEEDLFQFLALDAIRHAFRTALPTRVFRTRPNAMRLVDNAALGGFGQAGCEDADEVLRVEVIDRWGSEASRGG